MIGHVIVVFSFTTVMSFADSIFQTLQSAAKIRREGDGYLITDSHKCDVFVDNAMLAAADERLVNVMRYALYAHPLSAPDVINLTLAHWRSPGTQLSVAPEFFVLKLLNIKAPVGPAAEEAYPLRMECYCVQDVFHNLQIAKYKSYVNQDVPREWLQQHYPEVLFKFEALLACGESAKEASKSALEETVRVEEPVALTDITFDLS